MRIIGEQTAVQDIINDSDNTFAGEMVKGVVDVKKGILAVDAPMHADLEKWLLDQGSDQYDLWGVNLHSDEDEDLLEFDSMINIRPAQDNRSRSVENAETREKITEVVAKWVTR